MVYHPVTKLGVTTVVRGPDVLVDALTWGTKWYNPYGGGLVIPVTIYSPIANSAGVYVPSAAEIAAIKAVLEIYSQYLNVTFTIDQSAGSSVLGIRFVIGKDGGIGTLGFTQPPGETAFYGVPYSDIIIYHDSYLSSSLAIGGLDFATYLHEFGHALGLAHPHDHGGSAGSPSSVFPNVIFPRGDRGMFDLNQGINTIMGYNDGWQTGPLGPTPSTNYGYQASPMALDILALQNNYGANLNYHSGDDGYNLSGINGGYTCIWDAGGNDTITGFAGTSNVIDLNNATGAEAQGGGGVVSYALGIHGGITIAVGVTIENAIGGNFADVIIGNAANNQITGGGGADMMTGGVGSDSFIFAAVADSNGGHVDTILDFVEGVDHLDFSLIDANVSAIGDQAFTFLGEAATFTGAAQIKVVYSGSDTFVYANINSDATPEFCLKLLGHHVLSSADFIF